MLALAIWLGAMVFWTFVATPRIFAAHDRRTAGAIVGLVFPSYFRLGYVCGVVALGTAVLMPAQLTTALTRPLLVAMLAVTLYSGAILRARIRVLAERRRVLPDERTPEAQALARRFGMLHGVSMLLNVGVMLGALLVLFQFAARSGVVP